METRCFTLNELFANKRYQNCIKNNKLHFIRRINHYFIATIRSLLICWHSFVAALLITSPKILRNYSDHVTYDGMYETKCFWGLYVFVCVRWCVRMRGFCWWYVQFSHLIGTKHKSCVRGAHSYTWTNYILLIGFTQANVKNHRHRKFRLYVSSYCCVHQAHCLALALCLCTMQIAIVAKTNYQTPFNTQTHTHTLSLKHTAMTL